MSFGIRCGVFLAVTALLLAILTLFLNIFLGQGHSCESGSFRCSRLLVSADSGMKNGTSHPTNSTKASSSLEEDICLPQRFFCDGYPHCPNGEDEDKIACADWHGSTHVVESIAKTMGINESMMDCQISGFPEGCDCHQATRLYCSGIGLEKVPDGVTPNVSRMSLRNNSIHSLPPGAFSRYSLLVIYLQDNGMVKISPGAFEGQDKLQKLLLQDNSLTVLDSGTFVGLKELQWLILRNNKLEKLNLDDWKDMKQLQWVDLSFNQITLEGEAFPNIQSHLELFLSKNSIVRIEKNTFAKLSGLLLLDLWGNGIQYIDEDAFQGNPLLKELNLTYNQITTLPQGIFIGLHNLSKLRIGHNKNLEVDPSIFKELWSLSSLDLQDVELTNLNSETFTNFTHLDHIYFKSFYYCTQISTVPICKPNSDGVSSEDHLLVRPILRVSLWLVASITCLGNLLVLFGRQLLLNYSSNCLKTRYSNSFPSLPKHSKADESRSLIPSLFIRNLAASDLLMGLYLCVIGIKDIASRGIFREVARGWMASTLCSLVGIVAMTSSEVSVLILISMSIERFVVIVSVFSNPRRLTLRAAQFTLGIIWVLGLILAVVPALHWRHGASRFYGTNGMCLPLHLHDDLFRPGWQYSAFIFLGVNVAAMLLIAFSYGGMLYSIIRTRQLASTSTTADLNSPIDLHLALRFMLIVLTDALCWAPIATLKASALLGNNISADVYGWVVVFILPFNSALNPLIYTFTAPSFKLRSLLSIVLSSLRRVLRGKHSRARNRTESTSKSSCKLSYDINCEQDASSIRTANAASTDRSGTSTPSGKRSLEVIEQISLIQFANQEVF